MSNTSGPEPRIVVIGASAGGIPALQALLASLPRDLNAALFVVLHGATDLAQEILAQKTAMPVRMGANGQVIERNTASIAPPGAHMLLHDAHVMLRKGPRENMSRPAIDPLFRTAACTFGPRVVGIILSGALDDGVSGLDAVKRCGGVTIVQDPREAQVSSMPRSALSRVAVDHCLPVAEMAPLLTRLAQATPGAPVSIPMEVRVEAAIAAQEGGPMKELDKIGKLSPFDCPECHGPLWEISGDGPLRYRCRVGHVVGADTLAAAQEDEIERSLWRLVRAHEDRADLTQRIAKNERAQDNVRLAAHFDERSIQYREGAETIRRILTEYRASQNGAITTARPDE